jgi:hypothetical protein
MPVPEHEERRASTAAGVTIQPDNQANHPIASPRRVEVPTAKR